MSRFANKPLFKLIIVALVSLVCSTAHANADQSHAVRQAVIASDLALFEQGYNLCNQSALDLHIADNFEFYHDQGGTTHGKANFIASVMRSTCNTNKDKLFRFPFTQSESVEILKRNGEPYGAIHRGEHAFYTAPDEAALDALDSTARFVSYWELVNDRWQMKRVFSFDHRLPRPGADFLRTGISSSIAPHHTITALMNKLNVPTVGVGIIRDGQVQHLQVHGALGDGTKAPINTLFKVASLTKPVTALVALRLSERGSWDLDEPLARHYIDSEISRSPYLGKLTSRLVLRHRSGFPNWRYLEDDGRLVFQFEPDARQRYSGEGYDYLRKAIEAKLQRQFNDIAREVLFDPLGMTSTSFVWTDELNRSLYAAPREADGSLACDEVGDSANGAANLITTVGDYSALMAAMMRGEVLSQELYEEMIESAQADGEEIPYGLG
ncbi:MAG: serine hydrolase [Pseudomonadota bacterium]